MPIIYATYPVGAGIAMVSDGAAAAWAWAAYVQIVAAATIPNPCWLTGVLINVEAVETQYGDYAVATGAAAAEVDVAIIPYATGFPGATALTTWVPSIGPYPLPAPVRISGTPRVAGRLRKNTAASAAGFTTKVQMASGTDP